MVSSFPSPSSSDLFPLYDLPKLCFLAVAEQLDNDGRRHLSQTCQRFRRLLIPEDRYRNHSPNRDPSSIDNRSRLETRRLCKILPVKEEVSEYGFRIHLHYGQKYHYVHVRERVGGNQPSGFYESNGHFRDVIRGKMPVILHETIHELSKYFLFNTLNVQIKSERCLRLPIELSLYNCFRGIPITICLLMLRRYNEEKLSDAAISGIIRDLREMENDCVLEFHLEGYMVPQLGRLKRLIQQTLPDIQWDHSGVREYTMDVAPIKLKKRNGKLIGKFSALFAGRV